MLRNLLWVRYGFCTCLGLMLIALAAISSTGPEARSLSRTDTKPVI